MSSVRTFYQPADSLPETVLGKINLVTYNSIRYNLTIVPVNGVSIPEGLNAEQISESLNRIYSQAVIEWVVTLDKGIEVPFRTALMPLPQEMDYQSSIATRLPAGRNGEAI